MDILDKFAGVKVLVVGDVMVDKYLIGDVSRISPEAPVPVVNLKKTNLIAGGAANVAANIAGLRGIPYLVGVTGNDTEGRIFPKVLEGSGISSKYILKIENRRTTVKTRILAHNQQIARIDQEDASPLLVEKEEEVWKLIEKVLGEIEVVVISDYNKGLLSNNLISRLITNGKLKGKSVIVDPKGRDYGKYCGASVLTPNKLEVADACSIDGGDGELAEAGKKLIKNLKLEALLVTRGEEGMTLFENRKKPLHFNALARHVYDVTGAGDTVIAAFAVAHGAGANFSKAAGIANTAAGQVVEEVGTSIIKLEKLKEVYKMT